MIPTDLYYVALGIVITLVGFWVVVSVVLWRQSRHVMGYEDLDGDTRNTLFGCMFVFHLRETTWVRHVRYNTTLYTRLARTLALFGLFLCCVAVTVTTLLLIY